MDFLVTEIELAPKLQCLCQTARLEGTSCLTKSKFEHSWGLTVWRVRLWGRRVGTAGVWLTERLLLKGSRPFVRVGPSRFAGCKAGVPVRQQARALSTNRVRVAEILKECD